MNRIAHLLVSCALSLSAAACNYTPATMSPTAIVDVRMWDIPYSGTTPVVLTITMVGNGTLTWNSTDPSTPSCSGTAGSLLTALYDNVHSTTPLDDVNWGILVPLDPSRSSWQTPGCTVPAGAHGTLATQFDTVSSVIILASVEANDATCTAYCTGGHGAFCRESCAMRGTLTGETILEGDDLAAFGDTGTFEAVVRFE